MLNCGPILLTLTSRPMKILFTACLAVLTLVVAQAQESNDTKQANPQDVGSLDGVITALYESISGDAGVDRQWDRFYSLFTKEAQLISTNENEDGSNGYLVRSPQEFAEGAAPYFENQGFHEYETNRVTSTYGRVVHLMSTYASKRSASDPEPFNSGVNSIQLFNDGSRWWILNIYWAHASEKNPIPPQYLSNPKSAAAEDVATIDGVITALYGSISGGKGVPRQWDRFRSLFTNDAKLIPSGKNQEGEVRHSYRGTEEYIGWVNQWFLDNGFFEEEIARKTEIFGNVAHVFSTYISKSTPDGEPYARGINSIQLLNDGTRWWIVNIYWTGETPDNPIPVKYLPKGD